MLKRLWTALWRPSTKWGLGVLVLAGIVVGVVGWNGFHYALEMTTTTEFCISCHTMRDNNFEEYKTTIHYKNPMGVRAGCPDCHVPKSGWPLYEAKILAAKDLWGEIAGTIDTREKFEDRRLELAKQVWATMKATDSRECRSCHSFEAMDFAHQEKPNAATQMQQAMKDGGTCIDCHKGIAHHLPDMSVGYKSMFAGIEKAAATGTKSGTVYALQSTKLYAEHPDAADPGNGDGEVMPLAKADVVHQDGDWMQVKIDGWAQEGMERLLVAAMGKRAVEAVVSSDLAKDMQTSNTQQDADTGLNWSEGSVTVWVKAAAFTSDAKGLNDYGSELAGASCGACHTQPATTAFGANEWAGVIKDMKGNTTLDGEQLRFLQSYMQHHAKDMPKSAS